MIVSYCLGSVFYYFFVLEGVSIVFLEIGSLGLVLGIVDVFFYMTVLWFFRDLVVVVGVGVNLVLVSSGGYVCIGMV